MRAILVIEALGQRGEGIARHGEARVFVPLALPGETVAATIEDGRARLVTVLEPSPDRAEPFCPHFGACGGCQLQHMARPAYEAFKAGLVETALARAGLAATIERFVDAQGAGRRRATLHARANGVGYMRPRSHEVADLDTCPVLVPALARAPDIARAMRDAIGPCDVSLTATRTGIDVALRAPRGPRREAALAEPFRRLRLARLALNGEVLLQATRPVVTMGRAEVALPPGSFLQATEAAEQALAAEVLAGVAGARRVADLFCGLGPFALRLAETAQATALDSDRPAVTALDEAARRARGLKPLVARARDLFRDPLTRHELDGFDAVVLDPPRAGAEAQVREIALSRLRRVMMVSCDAASFARDAALLAASGFRIEGLAVIDQFAWSAHVEIAARFSR